MIIKISDKFYIYIYIYIYEHFIIEALATEQRAESNTIDGSSHKQNTWKKKKNPHKLTTIFLPQCLNQPSWKHIEAHRSFKFIIYPRNPTNSWETNLFNIDIYSCKSATTSLLPLLSKPQQPGAEPFIPLELVPPKTFNCF